MRYFSIFFAIFIVFSSWIGVADAQNNLTVSITDVPTMPQNAAFDITITFSQAVADFVAGDISLGGTATATVELSGSGTDYTASLTPTASGNLTIQVLANVAQDANGNNNTASTIASVSIDVDAPTVSITDVPTTPQSGRFEITITFSENVIGFDFFEPNDISLGGGITLSSTGLTVINAPTYTFYAEPNPDMSGNLTIEVPADVAEDAAGNGNTASSTVTIEIDTVAPTISFTAPSNIQYAPFDMPITFSEDVMGFEAGDIIFRPAGSATAELTGSGDSYTATITPDPDDDTIEEITIFVFGTSFTDLAGNPGLTISTDTVTFDRTDPTVTLSDIPTDAQNEAFDVTITFSEDVTGFVAGDIALGGTATATVELSGSDADYTASLTPTASGTLTIEVPANVAEDAAANDNTASSTANVSIDIDAPTVSITNVPTTPRNGPFDVTITFSEDVTGFEAGDVSLGGDGIHTVSQVNNIVGSTYSVGIVLERGVDGNVTIQVPADVAEDAAGNGNTASSTVTVEIDTVVPTISFTAPSDIQYAPFDMPITFSEDVMGFEAGDIIFRPAGSAMAELTGSRDSYTATITPDPDDDTIEEITISVLGPSFTDLAGNPGLAGIIGTATFDRTGPTTTLSDIPTDVQNGAFNITITFSEAVLNFVAGDIALGGTATATVSNLGAGSLNASDAEEYVATLTPTGSGNLTIQVLADVAQDAATNGNTASTIASVSIDVSAPTVSISGVPMPPQNEAFDITITFSEAVSGFVAGDITIGGDTTNNGDRLASVTDLTSDDDTVWTATLTPESGVDGNVTIQVPADVAEDAVTNGNAASSVSSFDFDLVPPTVAVSDIPTPPQNAAFDVTITFSEAVSGFVAGDITVGGDTTNGGDLLASVTDLTSDDNTVWTATLTPESGVDGNVTIQVPADVADDAATNGNTASSVSSFDFDLVPPTVAVSDIPTPPQNAAFDVTITFSEAVSGFVAGDITIGGDTTNGGDLLASVTDLTSDDNTVWTATLTPIAGADGDVTIQVPANIADDAATNKNTASTGQTVSVDTQGPSVSISGIPTTPQNGAFDVTIIFSEVVSGFVAGDITVGGDKTDEDDLLASVTDLTSDDNTVWTATLTPIAGANGDVTIQVPASVAQDTAMNGNAASTSQTVSVDLVRPSVSISDVPTPPQNAAFDVTITFSEDVTGFVVGDISLGGAGSANVSLRGSGADYTATLTPTGSGNLTIQVSANAAEDTATNGNTVSSAVSVVLDLVRPSVSISDVPTPPQNAVFDVTITFSEDVTGFEVGDITLGGTATATVELSGSDADYTASLTPTASGTLTIEVPANVAEDAATNKNTAATAASVTLDITGPTVSITDVPTTPQNAVFDVTITFSEVVSGFVAGDITIGGDKTDGDDLLASVTDLTSDDDTVWTATLTPIAGANGDVTIQVPASVAQDTATNGNAASTSQMVSVDLVRPSVSISDVPTPPQNGAFDVTITFSEAVTDFVAGDITVGGDTTNNGDRLASATGLTSDDNIVWTARITPTAGVDGDITIQVPVDVAADAATNTNTASSTVNAELDLVRPTVAISDVPTPPQNADFDITITFSEDVTGFEATDISLGGNAIAALNGSGKEYTASLTPTGSGNLTIQVPANAAADTATNGNAASATASVVLDIQGPTVAITDLPTTPQNAAFDVTITFSEAVTDFVVGDINLTGPATLDLTGTGNTYTATITPNTVCGCRCSDPSASGCRSRCRDEQQRCIRDSHSISRFGASDGGAIGCADGYSKWSV